MSAASPRKDFAARLHALREKAGLSVAELAEAVGLSRQAVYAHESGDSRPTWANVQAYAEVLGVPTDTFRDE